MQKILAIVGPTAVGKTALSVDLAKALGAEVICCDSMQIYRKMNIGTAKPTEKEQEGVVHHLLDVVDPKNPFSCADYQVLAREAIAKVSAQGKLPILCGGTGLYLDSVLYDRPFAQIPQDDALRAQLNAQDAQSLYEQLCQVDPSAAAATHANNKKRVVRALEIYLLTHKTKTQWDLQSQALPPLYDAVLLGIDFVDRACLYERIDRRVDQMAAQGLEQEVRSLSGLCAQTAAQAIGYREWQDYFAQKCTKEQVLAKIKQNSRNYAKRQLTWFHAKKVRWLMRTGTESREQLLSQALALLPEFTPQKEAAL